MQPSPHSTPQPDMFPPITEEERTWALFLHLSHLLVLLTGIPIVLPLILWMTKKDSSEFLDDQGKEVVNFEISLIIWFLLAGVSAFVIGIVTCGVGFALLAFPYILGIVGTIMGTVAATKGRYFRYPMCWRFIH